MDKEKILVLLKKSSSFPSLPSEVIDIFEKLEYPLELEIDEFKSQIKKYGNLNEVILDVVNSNYFSLQRKVNTLGQAIKFLGMKTMKEVIVAILLKSLFPKRLGRSEEFDRKKYWEHCVGTALASNEIAKKINHPYGNQFFFKILIHDIGVLALDVCMPDLLDEIYSLAKEKEISLLEAEAQMMNGATHCDIGSWLCKRWKIPSDVAKIIRHHHKPKINDLRTKIVHLGDVISGNYYQRILGIEKDYNQFKQEIIDSININEKTLDKISSNLQSKIKNIKENYNLNLLDYNKFIGDVVL
ncbi:HDOD domain-containing protein [Halanaerobacter jeridensis]|uniref:HD-like signal output (HDOD) protein n=1 Tax=Halanaerobacter jeridensis TaxID=706427 RepID=A0A938XR03_9FIRM|nr:HDOD domain-containing protein [Halanaerobacter jeridensis]MBM7556079.1 HD-like signal output (HDOD) protein [Halanaerobacter jeridensis]